MRYFCSIGAVLFAFLLQDCKKEKATTSTPDPADTLRINQIQIIASHNSYRKHTNDAVFTLLQSVKGSLPASLNPDDLDYTHLNFEDQMNNYPIRGLEIDFYNDPLGGDFYNRQINPLASLALESGIDALKYPGMKVLHIKDVDYETHYYTFVDALKALKNWSDLHPNHLPLFINIETKEEAPGDNASLAGAGFKKAIPFDNPAADKIDEEIKSVFGNGLDKILTPDKMRKDLPDLNEIVKQNKWPTLGEARGKIIFIMEGSAADNYIVGHPILENRAMFVYAKAGTPNAAFLILNGASTDEDSIRSKVSQGYIVRTRADSGTKEARTGNYTNMNAAFRSGAQITSTDYYRPDYRSDTSAVWTKFQVKFPNGELARLNPISAANANQNLKIKE